MIKVVFFHDNGVVWGWNEYIESVDDIPYKYVQVDELPEVVWNTPAGKRVRYTDDKKLFVLEDVPVSQEVDTPSELDKLKARLEKAEVENAALKQADLDNKESIAGLIQLVMSQTDAK
ncbi:hypothetical protein PPM_2626 [Paenibacillus polymyxa M1]|uniref:hypothetical protein n=1 Tax=Paenibacillus polymyxa TaxID=1406 RepID=UPI00021BBD34|nr:hypothetical protein [Paenibacillus polymyxa]CCC85563.1 hypothetical protein PPM_2626 [Paenibacillus polymyxa M1]